MCETLNSNNNTKDLWNIAHQLTYLPDNENLFHSLVSLSAKNKNIT